MFDGATPSELALLITAILGPAGLGVFLNRKVKKEDGVDIQRTDVNIAQHHVSVHAVMAMQQGMQERLDKEVDQREKSDLRADRMQEEIITLQRHGIEQDTALYALQRKYDRLLTWAMDLINRWDVVRELSTPPSLPKED